ncbi:MAG: hypothetical protein M5U28_06225 [Sandaracinaceae bacterium]|nr:hypothetical protein [Sandaracinaceae bacterium]
MQSTRSSKLLWLAAAFAALTALSAPGVAEAQRGQVDINTPHTGGRPFQLDIHGGFTWWGIGAATGVRFGIPIVDNGFVSSINNAVYINFGIDFYWVRSRCGNPGCSYWDYGAGLGLPVALHWEFYFNENWSAFVELGVNIFFHPWFWDNGRFDAYEGGYWFLGAVGGSFHINEWFLLTLRVGTPYIAFGITFQIG